MTLRLSNFGVRGFVGRSLTPKVVMDYAAAFGTFLNGGRVLVGRDTRYSSPMVHSAVVSSLMSCGCEIYDLGICPTPLLQFSVPRYQAAGAISISGGHHAMGWNSLTLIGADGAILEPTTGETVLDIFHAADFLRREASRVGSITNIDDFFAPYLRALAETVNVEAIRRAGFTVLIDPVGGAACPFLDDFAHEFGLHLVGINASPSGYLPREPEPRPRSALPIASFIKHVRGHAGFVSNSDMGRISLVTETGEPLSEEFTVSLIARHYLRRNPSTIVTNCCTSRMLDDLAAAARVPLLKTPVGQAYVVSRMIDEAAPIGGEGSGGVALLKFSRGFDGFLIIALVLEMMAETGEPLSALSQAMPRYHRLKKSAPCRSLVGYQVLDHVLNAADAFAPESIDLTDGVRFDWEDGWLHVRVSQTEQVVRLISESRERQTAERRMEEGLRLVSGAA